MTGTTASDPAHAATLNGAAGYTDVHNPATSELVSRVPRASISDVGAAVERARAAQERWAATPLRARRRILERFHDLVRERGDSLMDTIQSESGKSRRDAVTEVATVMGTARYYAVHAARHLREHRGKAAVPGITTAHVVYKPLGVVGLITPWNFPFLLGVGDALAALMAGNAVVTKPSELTPLSALAAAELLAEAGLPPDLFIVLNGPGSKIGQELIQHVDYVGFTGSTEVGRRVATAAAERLIPFSLELGGKNPMLVLEGARINDAVQGLISGAFCNSGQTCISIERVYVQESMWDAFVAAAVQRVGELKVGWSTRWDMDIGSLISEDQAEIVERHVRTAESAGATVLAGGRRRTDLGASFFEPTLLTGVTPDMEIFADETFGPVATLHKVRDEAEAVRLANESAYGLNASVWAGSRGKAVRELASQLNVGTANVNSTLLIYNSFDVPMGGVGDSGLGRRHGAHGIQRYCNEQAIVTGPARAGGYEAVQRLVTSERRAKAMLRVFGAVRHIPGLR